MAVESNSSNAPNIARICGPTLQKAIEEANRSFLRLCVTAARLGSSEPLAASLLGVDQAFLDVFTEEVAGRESILAASYGFPLFEPRIKDPSKLLMIAREGSGSTTSIAELTRTFNLPVIERGIRRSKHI